MNFTVDGVQAMQDGATSMAQQRDEFERESRAAAKERPRKEAAVLKKLQKDVEAEKKIAEDRESKILAFKIERRFKAFPWLREVVPQPGARASLSEKKEIDELQKLEMDLRGAEDRINKLVTNGISIVAELWGDGRTMTFLPEQARLNLSNFGVIVNSPLVKPEIDELILETVIEYPTFGQMGLAGRWMTTLLGAALLVHKINTQPPANTELLTKLGVMPANVSFLPPEATDTEPAAAEAPKPSRRSKSRNAAS
jgi:hypothetical protein